MNQNQNQSPPVNFSQLFYGMGELDPSSGGIYFEPGVYLLAVAKIKVDQSQSGHPYFVVEFDILESSHPQRPVGTRMSWMSTLKDRRHIETFLRNVKGCLLAIIQTGHPSVSLNQVNDQAVQWACSEQQPLTGVRVRAQATAITTSEGNPFTKVVFSPAMG